MAKHGLFLHRPSTGYKTMQGADWARADALLDCLVVATTFMIFHVAYIYIYSSGIFSMWALLGQTLISTSRL